jgi:hypothetical protein
MITKPILRPFTEIKLLAMRISLGFKIRKAVKLSAKDGQKRLVINYGGRFRIVTRKEFKGVTRLNKLCLPVRELEKHVLFKTY